MPRNAQSLKSKLEKFINEFGSHHFSTDGKILFCKVCSSSINVERKYQIKQHIETFIHQGNLKKFNQKDNKATQSLLSNSFAAGESKNEFFT